MKTVGEILKKARLEKNLTHEAVSGLTKIAVKYIQAIEANDYSKLPAAAFTKGFIQNLSKTVDLNPQNILAIFRRDFDQDERGRIIPRGITEPVSAPVSLFNPTTTTIILTVIVGLAIVIFLVRQIFIFVSAPKLTLSTPAQYAQVTSPVTVTGQTTEQASLTINNRIINVDETGNFNAQLTLPEGEHTLVIVAKSRGDKTTTLERIINVIKE